MSISASSAPPPGPGALSMFAILSTSSHVTMGKAARVVGQPANLGGTVVEAGKGGVFSKDVLASSPSGRAIVLGRATSTQGHCVSGGGAIDLRPLSSCNAGEDSSGANPLLVSLNDAIKDAAGFASALESYSSTQSFGASIKIKHTATLSIALTPQFNVVDVPALSIGRAASLVLDGPATASAVIRISGDLKLANSARLDLRGGLASNHVVILVKGSALSIAGNSSLSGTLLASAGACSLGNHVSLTGALVCGGKITIGDGVTVSDDPLDLTFLTAKLYLVDSPALSAPNVREYVNPAPLGGDIKPVAVLGGPATALLNPLFIALDRDGSPNLYVTNPNQKHLPQSINVYSQPINGDHAPFAFVFGPHTGLSNPAGVALDQFNNIYVANAAANRITVFPSGSHGDQSPMFTIEGPDTQLSSPAGLALDAAGNIWVVNTVAPISITEYQNGQCAAGSTCDQEPATVISNPALSAPIDLAFDHRSNIWVTNAAGSLLEFSPSGSLLATIAGDQTTLNVPFGIAIDGAGNILVADFAGASVVGFRADACLLTDPQPCDIKPDFALSGPSTELQQPAGLALAP